MKMSLERTEAGVDDKLDENGLSIFSEFEFEIVEERVSSMISIFEQIFRKKKGNFYYAGFSSYNSQARVDTHLDN